MKAIRFAAVLPADSDHELASEAQNLERGYAFFQKIVNSDHGIQVGSGSVPVEVLFRRCENDPTALRVCYRHLVQQEGARILLGGYPALANQVGMKVAEETKVPFVTASGAGEFAFNEGRQFSFGIFTPARHFLTDAVDLALAQDPSVQTFSVLSCSQPESREDGDAILAYCLGKGLQPVPASTSAAQQGTSGLFEFGHGEQDFQPIMETLRISPPHLLLFACHLLDASFAAVCAAKNGVRPRFWALADGPSDEFFQRHLHSVGFAADGLIEPLQWSRRLEYNCQGRISTPQQFSDQYQAIFGSSPGGSSAGAAACGFLCEEAIKLAQSVDPVAVRDALVQVGKAGLTTFYGPVRFDDRGLNVAKPVVTIQVLSKDGGFDTVVLSPRSGLSRKAIQEFSWRCLRQS